MFLIVVTAIVTPSDLIMVLYALSTIVAIAVSKEESFLLILLKNGAV